MFIYKERNFCSLPSFPDAETKSIKYLIYIQRWFRLNGNKLKELCVFGNFHFKLIVLSLNMKA